MDFEKNENKRQNSLLYAKIRDQPVHRFCLISGLVRRLENKLT